MSRVVVERSHHLGQQGCQELAEEIIAKLVERIGGSTQVKGDTILYSHISGTKGTLLVENDHLVVDVKMGFLVRAMAPAIKSEINRICDEHIGPQS